MRHVVSGRRGPDACPSLIDVPRSPRLWSTITVCRFLRARKWDFDASLAMFEAAEKWRAEFKVDELYADFEYPEKEEVDQVYPQYYHRTDKVRQNGPAAEKRLRQAIVSQSKGLTRLFSLFITGWPPGIH